MLPYLSKTDQKQAGPAGLDADNRLRLVSCLCPAWLISLQDFEAVHADMSFFLVYFHRFSGSLFLSIFLELVLVYGWLGA